MECKNCGNEILPEMRAAISVNGCPFCGHEIMDPERLEQMLALEDVLASKQFTNQPEVDIAIREKVIALLLEHFDFRLIKDIEEEPTDLIVVSEELPKKKKKAKVKPKSRAEQAKEDIKPFIPLAEGQSLDDLEVEEEESDEDDIPSETVTRKLKTRVAPSSTPAPTATSPESTLPDASFYRSAADGAFDADNIPAEMLHRVKAKRSDDGETSGKIRRK